MLLLLTLISYTPLRYVRNVAKRSKKYYKNHVSLNEENVRPTMKSHYSELRQRQLSSIAYWQ